MDLKFSTLFCYANIFIYKHFLGLLDHFCELTFHYHYFGSYDFVQFSRFCWGLYFWHLLDNSLYAHMSLSQWSLGQFCHSLHLMLYVIEALNFVIGWAFPLFLTKWLIIEALAMKAHSYVEYIDQLQMFILSVSLMRHDLLHITIPFQQN